MSTETESSSGDRHDDKMRELAEHNVVLAQQDLERCRGKLAIRESALAEAQRDLQDAERRLASAQKIASSYEEEASE
jgi:hypothetical protein